MSEFRSYTCWDPQTVRRTIFSDVGAIDIQEDALFLSTNVSFPIERRKPSDDVVDEEALLGRIRSAIDTDEPRNLVVAITGPSGSGKSHLVRWLRANLDLSDPRIEVVYIPRRVTSLRQITQLLLEQLGGSLAEEIQASLDNAVSDIGEVALAESLLNRLWELVKFRPIAHPVQYGEQLIPLLDAKDESRGRGGIAHLLGGDKVREYLLRPGGVLRQLARSVLGQRGGVETEKPAFSASELELTKIHGIRPGLPSHAATALNILSRENGRRAAAALLNDLRDTAIQEVLGLRQGRGLREVFSEARERLAGRQLVLMFEDLALMDFVEGAVLDEFANHGDATHAPLRVVFAVTDDKYATLEETIEGRVTDRYWIGETPLHGDTARRNEFFARYLNAARVGRDALVLARQTGDPVPNKCKDCDFRRECHSAFGKVNTEIGDIGLYPYNEDAIRHGTNRQFDRRHRENRRLTPRVIIDELIDYVLLQAHRDLDANAMPSDRVATALRDDSVSISVRDLVPEFQEGTDEIARLFNVRAYWFECGRESEQVAIAFDLPESSHSDGLEPLGTDDDDGEPTPVKRRSLPDDVRAVIAWQQGDQGQGDHMEALVSTELRRLLHELTEERVNLDRYLIHSSSAIAKDLLKAAIGDASFEIAGAPGAPRSGQLSFPIARDYAGYRLLVAALWLKDHKHWVFDDPERKWDMPRLRDQEELPIELETFLGNCAFDVEASVVSTLFTGGDDPAQVAADLDVLAQQSSGGTEGARLPESWARVAEEARRAVKSDISRDIISALAAARQGPNADPAVIDKVRVTPRDVDTLPLPLEGLRTFFPELANRWGTLRTALEDALEPTVQDLRNAVGELGRLLGEDGPSELGAAALQAGRMANNEGLFDRSVGISAFEDAARRVENSSVDQGWWRSFSTRAEESVPRPSIVLNALSHASSLLQAVDDLRLLESGLNASRALLDARLREQTGGRSLDERRREMIKARDGLLAELQKMSEAGGAR